MNSCCYEWLAFVSMAFSAAGIEFPAVPRIELGEALIVETSIGTWIFTIAPDLLFCELSVNEGGAIFTCDLSNPTNPEVLRSIDLLINLAKLYDHCEHL